MIVDLDVIPGKPVQPDAPPFKSAQIPGTRISVCHGVGGMFAASGTIIMSNEAQ